MTEIQKMLDRAAAVSPTWQVYRHGSAITVSFMHRRPWWKVWEPRLFEQEFSRDEMIVFWQMLAKVSRAVMIQEPLDEALTERQEFFADYERAFASANQEAGPLAFASEVAAWREASDRLRIELEIVDRLVRAHNTTVAKLHQIFGRATDLMFEKGYRKY